MLHFVQATFWKQYHELIAPEAHCQVRATNRLLYAFGEARQEQVARRMTQFVIDLFESVQVQEQDSQRTLMPYRAADFFCEPLLARACRPRR